MKRSECSGKYCICKKCKRCGHCDLKRSFYTNDEAFEMHVTNCSKRPK